jgi:hypothetical protein
MEDSAMDNSAMENRVLKTDITPGVYRHFKGKDYLVIGVAVHSETGQELVVYRPLYGDYQLTVRPKAMFTEPIERDGYSGPRFKLLKQL